MPNPIESDGKLIYFCRRDGKKLEEVDVVIRESFGPGVIVPRPVKLSSGFEQLQLLRCPECYVLSAVPADKCGN